MARNPPFVFAPSYLEITKLFIYLPEGGLLCKRFHADGTPRTAGNHAIVGSYPAKGRRTTTLNGHKFYIESLIWALIYREWPFRAPDHRNDDPSDNTLENLYLPKNTPVKPLLGVPS